MNCVRAARLIRSRSETIGRMRIIVKGCARASSQYEPARMVKPARTVLSWVSGLVDRSARRPSGKCPPSIARPAAGTARGRCGWNGAPLTPAGWGSDVSIRRGSRAPSVRLVNRVTRTAPPGSSGGSFPRPLSRAFHAIVACGCPRAPRPNDRDWDTALGSRRRPAREAW